MKAKEHFNDRASSYEDLIVRIVPHHPLFFGTVIDFIPSGRARILELGSGTGLVTELILKQNPRADITCIDMTPEMLEVARAKEALRDVTLIEGDFRDVWPEGSFDAIVSTLCFHHLTGEDRATMAGNIFASLVPGGWFINGDVFRPESEWEESVYMERWLEYMHRMGLPPAEAEGMVQKRAASYRFLDTVTHFRQTCASAGFERILLPFVYDIYGVLCCQK
jgi:tRNA (cmo5U34)-methyltransferase